ncbi:LysR substrate-binding domain-containing protein [Pseudoroseomonas wenyumeiae]
MHAASSVIGGPDLGPLLAAFLEERPGIRVELREAASSTVLHDLMEGRADLGLITGAGEVPAPLQSWPWRQDQLVVLAPLGHDLASRSGLHFAEVLDHPLVGVQEGGALSLLLEEQAQRLGRNLAFRFHVVGTDAARSLVAAGLGLTVMPDGLVRGGLEQVGLKSVLLREAWARRSLRLVSRPTETLPRLPGCCGTTSWPACANRARWRREMALLPRDLRGHDGAMRNSSDRPTVLVREVGPRDGLQNARAIMPTEAKLRWIAAMVEAGLREIDVASFVPPPRCRRWPMPPRSCAPCARTIRRCTPWPSHPTCAGRRMPPPPGPRPC